MASATAAASFLGSVAIQVAKWLAAPIKRQLNYLCCFSNNITGLENEAEKLKLTAEDLQRRVDTARDDVRIISAEVETWLQNSKDIKEVMNKIMIEVPNVGSGCLKLLPRFSLSKRAKKTTDLSKELRDQYNFNADAISQPRPPAAMEAIPLERTYEFESRKQFEEDIMETLRLGDANMIGIYGMGGIGKTIMAKRVMNRALKEHVFEEVVMAVVSQPVDKSKVQLEIAGSLRLNLEGESWQARVQKLHARLSGTKRILLILDDVWERLVFEDLGIPSNHKGCTILSTSRNNDVLSAMNVQKVFRMQVLSEVDAWFLFRERASTCVDETKFNSIAKQVVNECKGLPIALTTVGAALRDEKNVCIWKDALRQLRQCDPDIPALIANVYTPIKLSYDVLGPKHKSAFLLCCLYPEDVDIPLERLTYSCMGLGIFEGGIRNVEEARNRMRALANMLKSRSLLLDSKYGNDDYVRMHDVVRDVCIFIAKHEGYIGGNDCTWITLAQSFQLPTQLGFPNLRLLMLTRNSTNEEFKMDSRFLEGVRDLRELSIENDYLLTSLPLITQSLKNVKILVINSCRGLETLFGVGELVNLEILICHDCDLIDELPAEMRGLNQLKVLDLTVCKNLKRIGQGIISCLVGLEELKMRGSFKEWEIEDGEERDNAALRELEALINLRCLEVDIEDPALAAENMCLSSKLEKYDIRFSTARHVYHQVDFYRCNKRMRLFWMAEISIGHWIEMQLLRDTNSLVLEGNGATEFDLTKLRNIVFLELRSCESMKKIGTFCAGATVLSTIEHLRLKKLPKLEKIWNAQISTNFFQNLMKLVLDRLPALKQVWECISRGMEYLPQLEVLSIMRCEMMERVFLWEGEDENENNSIRSPNSHITTKILPKLKQLKLIHLPNLTSFYQGIAGIEFPQLRILEIQNCIKMKIMVSQQKESNVNNLGGRSSTKAQHDHHCQMSFGCLKELYTDRNPFCDCKIDVSLFNGLEMLTIVGNEGSTSFITPSIAENLLNLKVLCVQWSNEMVQVIQDDEEKLVSSGQRTLLLPKLLELRLVDLSKLVSFCEGKCDVELPSLRELNIRRCNNMKIFTLGLIDAPNLESVRINSDVHLGAVNDLNGILQQHYFTRAKEEQQEEENKKGSEEKESVGEIEEEQNS